MTTEDRQMNTQIEETKAAKARKPFPGWLYGVLFVLFDAIGVAALEWGVTLSSRVELSSPAVGWGFVSKMWTDLNFVAVLNLLLCGIVYLVVLMISNRFWVATPIYLALTFIAAVVERFKVSIRYEAVLPADVPENRRGQPDELHALGRAMDHSLGLCDIHAVCCAVRVPQSH